MHREGPDEKINGHKTNGQKSLRKIILPLALAVMAVLNPSCKKNESNRKDEINLPKRVKNPIWDSDNDYSRKVDRGEFSREEYKARLTKLPNGEVVFKDIGALIFYRVEKGDTIQLINEKLSKYKQFEHLKTASKRKIKFFNVPQRSLTPGMLIPIPLAEEDRAISDEQFVNYCNDAIDDLLLDKEYGHAIMKIIKKSSKKELLTVMLAIAKQESGGKPIGQFELHRWEPHQSAFSFSVFHILMKGPGIKARKNLNLTEGQLYHPKNAAKLFLAFLCEKSKEGNGCNPEKFFPMMSNLEKIARFYNGKAWKRINPNYTKNLSRYYQESKRILTQGRQDQETGALIKHQQQDPVKIREATKKQIAVSLSRTTKRQNKRFNSQRKNFLRRKLPR